MEKMHLFKEEGMHWADAFKLNLVKLVLELILKHALGIVVYKHFGIIQMEQLDSKMGMIIFV